jgi:hypothetical protein
MIPYVDAIGRAIDKISLEYANKYSMRDPGMHNDVRYVPFTSHVPFGKVVSATPNGRAEWFPLSDGSSAHRLGTQKYRFLDRTPPLGNARLDKDSMPRLQSVAAGILRVRAWNFRQPETPSS